jgi:hypothetical protein
VSLRRRLPLQRRPEPLDDLPEPARSLLRESVERHRRVSLSSETRRQILETVRGEARQSPSGSWLVRALWIAWAAACLSLAGTLAVWSVVREPAPIFFPAEAARRPAIRLFLDFPPLWSLGVLPTRWASDTIRYWTSPAARASLPRDRFAPGQAKMAELPAAIRRESFDTANFPASHPPLILPRSAPVTSQVSTPLTPLPSRTLARALRPISSRPPLRAFRPTSSPERPNAPEIFIPSSGVFFP